MDLGLCGRAALITGGSKGISKAVAPCPVDEPPTQVLQGRPQEGPGIFL